MKSFAEWLKNKFENFGGSAGAPSFADEQGDGGEGVAKNMSKPGAFPTYEMPKKKKKKDSQGTST